MTSEEIRQLAAMDGELAPKYPQVAIGVAESDYLYGMIRMWNMQAESATFQTYTVRAIDAAVAIFRQHGIELDVPEYPPGCDA